MSMGNAYPMVASEFILSRKLAAGRRGQVGPLAVRELELFLDSVQVCRALLQEDVNHCVGENSLALGTAHDSLKFWEATSRQQFRLRDRREQVSRNCAVN